MSDITKAKMLYVMNNRDALMCLLINDTPSEKVESLRAKLTPILDTACAGFKPSEAAFALQMCVDAYLSLTFDFEKKRESK